MNVVKNFVELSPTFDRRLLQNLCIYQNVIPSGEYFNLCNQLSTRMQKFRYEKDHFDNVITGYRELSLRQNVPKSFDHCFRILNLPSMLPPHVLDLDKNGEIGAHIDHIEHSGDIIAGLSLLSESVMLLTHKDHPSQFIKLLLIPNSLYVYSGALRYEYKHSVLNNQTFREKTVTKERRISVLFRNVMK